MVTSYGWISARHAVEQDAPLPLDEGRAQAPGEQLRRELLHERAADLAAHLLAPVGDLQRRGQDRLRAGPRAPGRPPGPKSVGNIVRQASASVVSPFMTARASTRWGTVASASSLRRAPRAGRPGSRRTPPRARPWPRPGTSQPLPQRHEHHLREGGEPVDGAMRIRDQADLVDRPVDAPRRPPRRSLRCRAPPRPPRGAPSRRPRGRSRTSTRPRSSRRGLAAPRRHPGRRRSRSGSWVDLSPCQRTTRRTAMRERGVSARA